jgi:hypothetical protein
MRTSVLDQRGLRVRAHHFVRLRLITGGATSSALNVAGLALSTMRPLTMNASSARYLPGLPARWERKNDRSGEPTASGSLMASPEVSTQSLREPCQELPRIPYRL